ncbi:hypothetical protein Bca52824_075445 [Brassica carinata]|uniref:NIF system FeS cluster assembly NifU N-terminal domain-containing protein n=1 Tax=Brassica carinata TaxID=52824 RepID=A0A8X7PQG0_BRACI|nr:hypothetical protein Bca52824_075445 [Brassica carinata]
MSPVTSLILDSRPWAVAPLSQLLPSLLNGSRAKQAIAKHLRLPSVKLHCSMLAEDAIKSAVQNYKQKKAIADAAVA